MNKTDADCIELELSATSEEEDQYYGKRTIAAGVIGQGCDAAVAYSMRSFPSTAMSDATKRRLILGREIEVLVLKDLKTAGIPVQEKDLATGRQIMATGYEGHVKAYLDGLIRWKDAEPEPLEIKSMAQTRFNAVKRHGLRKAEPVYYAQVQTIMALLGADSTIFVTYNKNNSEYAVYRILFDPEYWEVMKLKIERVLTGEVHRTAKDPAKFPCITCPFSGACLKGVAPPEEERACHHCMHGLPDKAGQWWCVKHSRITHATCSDFSLFEPRS